jgi:WD40 repeat protein
VALSPDGQRLATVTYEGLLRDWDVESGALRRELPLPVAPHVEALNVMSPGFDKVAVGGRGRVTICDGRTGEILATLKQSRGISVALAFSPDGSRFAATGQDNLIQVWDANSWAHLRTLRGHKFHLRSLAFSPDGRWLASGGHDNLIKIWDTRSWREVVTLTGSKAVVWTLVFSADSRTLLSASDEAVRFWNVATWREVGTVQPPVPAKLLILSPAMTSFAVADAEAKSPLHFWHVPTLAEMDRPQ